MNSRGNTEFVVKAVPSAGDASEFRKSMKPHPLVHQELPHDPAFGVYNRRLRSLHYGNVRWEELYWRLRRQVGLAHTGELATEIRGPDAEAMLNRVFTRDVSRVRVGRCSYQLACFADSVTPFAAGFGSLVDLDKADFVGKAALAQADKRRRTWGLKCEGGVARHGDTLFLNGESAGRVCSSAWSPFLQHGVGIVRLKDPDLVPGTEVRVECVDGTTRTGELCELPMYDRAGEIPRGKRTDIPEIPIAE